MIILWSPCGWSLSVPTVLLRGWTLTMVVMVATMPPYPWWPASPPYSDNALANVFLYQLEIICFYDGATNVLAVIYLLTTTIAPTGDCRSYKRKRRFAGEVQIKPKTHDGEALCFVFIFPLFVFPTFQAPVIMVACPISLKLSLRTPIQIHHIMPVVLSHPCRSPS